MRESLFRQKNDFSEFWAVLCWAKILSKSHCLRRRLFCRSASQAVKWQLKEVKNKMNNGMRPWGLFYLLTSRTKWHIIETSWYYFFIILLLLQIETLRIYYRKFDARHIWNDFIGVFFFVFVFCYVESLVQQIAWSFVYLLDGQRLLPCFGPS